MDEEFKEIFFSEIISITGGLFAGSMLAVFANKLFLIPGLLILLPGFLEMRGNISGSLAGRLSVDLHLKKLKPDLKFKNNILLKDNIAASSLLVVLVAFILGVVAYSANFFIFNINAPAIIYIAVIAAVLSNIIEIPLTVISTFWLFKHRYDPDNIMGPYITTTGDIISVLSILIAIMAVA